jgi:putative hydrolase of the HAD superfamily
VAWVMFDYGGVISRWPSEQDMAMLAAAAGISVRRLSDAYWQRRPAYDRAEVDGAAYWQQVGLIAGRGQAYREAEIAELIRLDTDSWLHLEAGTVALIEELAAVGHRLALLSNAPTETAEAIAGLPVARHFEHLIFSCELKMAKPATEFFTAALARLGAAAAEVIFIDDRPENVAAAVTLGMQSILFTSPGQARALLAQLLARHRW